MHTYIHVICIHVSVYINMYIHTHVTQISTYHSTFLGSEGVSGLAGLPAAAFLRQARKYDMPVIEDGLGTCQGCGVLHT